VNVTQVLGYTSGSDSHGWQNLGRVHKRD